MSVLYWCIFIWLWQLRNASFAFTRFQISKINLIVDSFIWLFKLLRRPLLLLFFLCLRRAWIVRLCWVLFYNFLWHVIYFKLFLVLFVPKKILLRVLNLDGTFSRVKISPPTVSKNQTKQFIINTFVFSKIGFHLKTISAK